MSAPRYWAFISYSHRDEAVAKALQRRIETYRLPPRLIGRNTSQGAVPRQAKPLFRDRDELHAGADLQTHVREALAASRWLIVVCTPDAARSPWVEREIVEFKRLHGESRVLALIARGEPYASRMPGREAEECFPHALRHALDADGEPQGAALEPIAADLRAHADGPRRAPLKLLAGMVGVGFDELVRRDHARRVRWLGAIAGASALGMAVLTVLTVLALRARDEARQQRAQAEGLIEFMLVDLRKKLEPVGRLDVLDAVGEKALAHYEAQPGGRLDATSLGHRARALHLVGEIRELRGQLDDALLAFEAAAQTTGELLARAPTDGARLYDHAQSEFWVGYLAWRRGLHERAEASFANYLALARRLTVLDAARVDWQVEVAYAHSNLGTLWLDRGRPGDAHAAFLQARPILERLAPLQPALWPEVATNLGWIAKAQERLGQLDAAVATLEAQVALYLRLPEFATDRGLQRGAAAQRTQLARLALYRGDAAAALAQGRRALEEVQVLTRLDPDNTFWRQDEVDVQLVLAQAQLAAGDQAAAAASADAARPLVHSLAATDASHIRWQVTLRGGLLVVAARLASPQASAAAWSALAAWLADTAAHPLDVGQRQLVAGAELALGDAQARAGHTEAAAARWRAALQRLAPEAGGADPYTLALLAHAQQRLGEREQAQGLARRAQATGFRHPLLMADLQQPLDAVGGPASSQSTTR